MIKNKRQITMYFAPSWQSVHLACEQNTQERSDRLGGNAT